MIITYPYNKDGGRFLGNLELSNVFHAFPRPVRRSRRNRMVLAANKAAASLGRCAGGGKIRFWIPISGRDDVYIHFSILPQ